MPFTKIADPTKAAMLNRRPTRDLPSSWALAGKSPQSDEAAGFIMRLYWERPPHHRRTEEQHLSAAYMELDRGAIYLRLCRVWKATFDRD